MTPFYNSTIRNIVVAFGNLFSDMQIVRVAPAPSTATQTIAVPLSYSNQEKWLQRVQQQPDLDSEKTYGTLPRLAFELGDVTYDATRKLPRMGKVGIGNATVNTVYTPVPYNVTFNLYILSSSQEDGLQILEQILPSFAPELTVTITAGASGSTMTQNVPIVLGNIIVTDENFGSLETRRLITWTLSFTAKLNLYGGTRQIGVINKATVYINNVSELPSSILPANPGDLPVSTYTVSGSGGVITSENWMEQF